MLKFALNLNLEKYIYIPWVVFRRKTLFSFFLHCITKAASFWQLDFLKLPSVHLEKKKTIMQTLQKHNCLNKWSLNLFCYNLKSSNKIYFPQVFQQRIKCNVNFLYSVRLDLMHLTLNIKVLYILVFLWTKHTYCTFMVHIVEEVFSYQLIHLNSFIYLKNLKRLCIWKLSIIFILTVIAFIFLIISLNMNRSICNYRYIIKVFFLLLSKDLPVFET